VEQEVKMKRKNANAKVAHVIALNLAELLGSYRTNWDKTNKGRRCCECGQKLANPHTQEWLASEVGMTKPQLMHYLQGNRMINLVDLTRIAQRMDVSLDALTKGLEKIDFDEE
jgi:hypothetical protein